MPQPTRLSVNVDHVATLRQARGTEYPDVLEAARIAEAAGAHGITVHLRQDRRHIQESDVERLAGSVEGKLNLEMCTLPEMVALALELRPAQVTLVPERAAEVTTEGGLDLRTQLDRVIEVAARLGDAGIETSVFIDPEARQIERLAEAGHDLVPGFEINTDAYSRARGAAVDDTLLAIQKVSRLGAEHGFHVYAGHGLTVANVAAVASVPEIEELNIGHSVISHAVLVGLDRAVRDLLGAMA